MKIISNFKPADKESLPKGKLTAKWQSPMSKKYYAVNYRYGLAVSANTHHDGGINHELIF